MDDKLLEKTIFNAKFICAKILFSPEMIFL